MTCATITPAPRPMAAAAGQLAPLLLLLAAGLSACGGGGGGSSSPPPPPAPPPAFALASAVPADAASGVARDAAITATFNAALDTASVTPANVTLTGPGNIAVPATLAVTGGSTVEVKPKAGALPADTTYTLSLAAAIKDGAGRTLPQAVTRSFSTAAAHWSATAGELAPYPRFILGLKPAVLTDAAGRTTAAWVVSDDVNASQLYAARLDAMNGTWSTPTLVATGGSHVSIQDVALAPGPGGDVFLTWDLYSSVDASGLKFQFSRLSAGGGGWSAPVDIRTEAERGMVSGVPVTVGDAAGNLTLLYGSTFSLYATRLDARTNTWSDARAIEHPYGPNHVHGARAGADAQGNIVATWLQIDDDGGDAIYAARYDAATAQWAAALRVSAIAPRAVGTSQALELVVDDAGVATVAWSVSVAGGGSTLWASRLDAQGRAWSPAVRLDRADPAAPTAERPLLVADRAGTVTAVWDQGILRGAVWDSTLRSARWAPGAADWSAYTTLAPASTPLVFLHQTLRCDPAGNLLLFGDNATQSLAMRYHATTGQWQPAVPFSTPASGTTTFMSTAGVGMDGAGNAVAVWLAQKQLATGLQSGMAFNRLR